MSLALYRKYRPGQFSDVIGQEHVTGPLSRALNSGNINHAYLFTGTRGVGKTSIARLFAKAIICEQPKSDLNPCLVCASCRDIDAGNSMDYLEIDGASNNSVDDVRSLIENVQYLPARGKYKIYVIDEVHMLSVSAFNALLKTLEEPPQHAIFILATTDPHKLLGTVISRCQRYDFKNVP
ncbi:MAG: DNA polymerase III subunit gamma/tau, partial [Actinobacteria bacterium]|nr:DNA polymerase III subunit gamma/tau [Actinomycetota bacterium]